MKPVLHSFSCNTMPQESTSKCFGSSKTSRISLIDLAGFDRIVLDGATKEHVKEGKYIKKSMSKLGYVQWITECFVGSGNLRLLWFSDADLFSFHLLHIMFHYIILSLNLLTKINWNLYYLSCLCWKKLVPKYETFWKCFWC